MSGLTVAVLTYNNDELTNKCLSSILKADWPTGIKTELLVLDNGSEPASCPVMPHFGKSQVNWFRLHRLPKNVGNIAGFNACLEQAQYHNILIVANDVTLLPNTIVELWKAR